MPIPNSACNNCRHNHFNDTLLDAEKQLVGSCDAYPDGIPSAIYLDKFAFFPDAEPAEKDAACHGIPNINYDPMTDIDWSKLILMEKSSIAND